MRVPYNGLSPPLVLRRWALRKVFLASLLNVVLAYASLKVSQNSERMRAIFKARKHTHAR